MKVSTIESAISGAAIAGNTGVVFLPEGQHMNADQQVIMKSIFGSRFIIIPIPVAGWSRDEMKTIEDVFMDETIAKKRNCMAIFATDKPSWLIKQLGGLEGFLDYKRDNCDETAARMVCSIFHQEEGEWNLI